MYYQKSAQDRKTLEDNRTITAKVLELVCRFIPQFNFNNSNLCVLFIY